MNFSVPVLLRVLLLAGTFCALDICLSQLQDVGSLNVCQTVRRMRTQRAFSIQTPDQYYFCYNAILEHAQRQGLLSANQWASASTCSQVCYHHRLEIKMSDMKCRRSEPKVSWLWVIRPTPRPSKQTTAVLLFRSPKWTAPIFLTVTLKHCTDSFVTLSPPLFY